LPGKVKPIKFVRGAAYRVPIKVDKLHPFGKYKNTKQGNLLKPTVG
jgi:hypothetical protein